MLAIITAKLSAAAIVSTANKPGIVKPMASNGSRPSNTAVRIFTSGSIAAIHGSAEVTPARAKFSAGPASASATTPSPRAPGKETCATRGSR